MTREIKLIAIDLDDTLLRDDHTVTERTKTIIKKMQNEGKHIVIATGRMYDSTWPVAKKLGLGDVPLIIYSGGVVQLAESGTIVYENPIPVEVAKQVLAMGKDNNWYLQLYIDDTLLIHTPNQWTDMYEKSTGTKAVVLGDDFYEPTKGPMKILMIAEPTMIDIAQAALNNSFGDLISTVRSKPHYLEIMAPENSKGNALRNLGESLGIAPEYMMAFGNAPNDISMLEYAGVGVAVANAEAEVKSKAQLVCPSNNEDGVASVLETL